MPRRPRQYDCIVVGGGPAGCTVAARLAEWGRCVLLLGEGARGGGPLLEETIGADAAPLLLRHGLTASIRAHGFHGTPRAGVAWGDGELRVKRRPRERRGFKVVRPLFDRDFRRFAEALGAHVVTEARVLRAEHGAVAAALGGARPERLRGRCVVVADGAAAQGDLLPTELVHRLPVMTAVTALVDRPRRLRDAVVIEALEQGWTRWLPLGCGRAAATLFADREETRECGVAETLAAARRGSSGPFAAVRAPELHAADVDVRLRGTAEGVFLCGDGASTVDPILGQGIEKAIRSGEACAVAVNSCLEDRSLIDRVLAHHDNDELELYLEHARRALGLYLQEVRFADRPFWAGRHGAVKVEVEVETPALPHRLAVLDDVMRREGLQVRGRVLEPVRGWGRRDSNAVHARVACVPVEPLIELIETAGWTDEVLDLASVAPELYMYSRAAVQRALTELVRLGIIGEADGGGTP